jgi:hypothetical protein
MKDQTPDEVDLRIDAALSRLPQWNPRADFSTQLAAGAARQHAQAPISRPLVNAEYLLRVLTESALFVLASLGVAGFLVWGIPWDKLTQYTALVGFISIAALLCVGAWATLRTMPRD